MRTILLRIRVSLVAFAVYPLLFSLESAVAQTSPYAPSPLVAHITWDFTHLVRLAPGSDLWPTTWAEDDNVYTAWGDGGGFDGSNTEGRVSLGFAQIGGQPPSLSSTINVWGGKNCQHPATFGGKVAGLLAVKGVLYAVGGVWPGATTGVNTWDSPYEARLLWSSNRGRSWHYASWAFADAKHTMFAPSSFLNFGKDYAGARDQYVYIYGGKPWWAGAPTKALYLMRAPKEQLTRRSAYQYFSGVDAKKNPTWTTNIQQRKPIFVDPHTVSLGSVIYNVGLKRYLLLASHGQGGHLGIFDAPEPWGPWTTVAYYNDWGGFGGDGDLMYSIPTKWISADGTICWMIFSSIGEFDSFNLVQATLTLH